MSNVGWFVGACGQVYFQNLDFESANLSPTAVGEFPVYVPFSSALPDWTGYLGTTQATEALQNATTIGDASIDILGPNYPVNGPFGWGTIDGDYSVLLQPGAVGTGTGSASISQAGAVPLGMQSLQFSAIYAGDSGFLVSFAGRSLSPVVIASEVSPSGLAYNVYGVNMSAFAGETGDLEFIAPFGPSALELDDITFSASAVPEPNMLALTAVGGLICVARRWFERR
jgi:hypothetical protein